MRKIQCAISGSFRKYYSELREYQKKCTELGIDVISPRNEAIDHVENGFAYLENDKGSCENIEYAHMDAIEKSTFLLVVNPEGYIGNSTMMEIGYAIAN